MKKLEPLFGFEMNYDEEGLIEVNGVCNYPQEKPNCMELFNKMELLKIDESKVEFPLRIVHWIETINPIDKNTIMNYFNLEGIKKIVEENKTKLIGKTTFVKPEISYPKKNKFPNLHIHFYQVAEDEGIYIIDEYDMCDTFHIQYENTKQFTTKRIADLEKYVNTQELFQIPFLPMEMVRFDENENIQDFQQHLYAQKTVKLPF
jgi:DNA-binding transcriptional MerR regulator